MNHLHGMRTSRKYFEQQVRKNLRVRGMGFCVPNTSMSHLFRKAKCSYDAKDSDQVYTLLTMSTVCSTNFVLSTIEIKSSVQKISERTSGLMQWSMS